MKSMTVKDILVPVDQYATVYDNATFFDAVQVLAKSQEEVNQSQEEVNQSQGKHLAVLVLDKGDNVIGKISQIDVIRCLEPKYNHIENFPELNHWALSKETANKMLMELQLWQKPLKDICKVSGTNSVVDVMHTPQDGEYVNLDATLDEAVNQLIIGHHQSLLVIDDNDEVVGVVHLTDIFKSIVEIIEQCEL